MDKSDYSYNGRFDGNILVAGRTGCGKTTFAQNLAKKNLFGDIKEVFWVSKIDLSEEREKSIKECFQGQNVHFSYPDNIDNFNYVLEMCKRNKAQYIEKELGEKMVSDKLVVMDDVSGLADKSDEFANFLTVSRKYGISCVYIFHTIYPSKQNWQMIASHTQMYNFFPGSLHAGSIVRVLYSFASRFKTTYIPH